MYFKLVAPLVSKLSTFPLKCVQFWNMLSKLVTLPVPEAAFQLAQFDAFEENCELLQFLKKFFNLEPAVKVGVSLAEGPVRFKQL